MALAGLEGAEIGDTVAAKEAPEALPRLRVDEPTVALTLSANTSPFSGREGKHVTGQKLKERLFRELRTNVPCRWRRWPPRSLSSGAGGSSTWPSSWRPCAGRGTSSAWASPGCS